MAFKRSFAVLFVLAASVLASPSSSPSKLGKSGSCSSKEFYYKTKDCCLPHGGPPAKPPPPPPGKSCPPSSHYWSKNFSCCVPAHPPPEHSPPPQCSNGNQWNPATQCCEHHAPPTHTYTTHKPSQTPTKPGHGGYPGNGGSHGGDHGGNGGGNGGSHGGNGGGNGGSHGGNGYPSSGNDYPSSGHGGDNGKPTQPSKGGHGYKKRSAAPLCPRSFEACPISGLISGAEYECLDTNAELRSCGGCASTGKGQDCTAIKGAWNVGCEAGSCAVYTCALGFKVSNDNKSCTPI